MSILRLDDLLITRGDEKYAELGVFMDLLRSLALVHQTAHWQTSGPAFYGDHLLFQRLYDETNGEIDGVAEKAVGLGSFRLVDSKVSIENMRRFLLGVEEVTVLGSPSESSPLVRKSLKAENAFIRAGETLMEALEKKGQLTRGLENLLGGILDLHEGHVYLLKQRLSAHVLVSETPASNNR